MRMEVCIICEQHFILLYHLMNLVVKVLLNASFVSLFLFVGMHSKFFTQISRCLTV